MCYTKHTSYKQDYLVNQFQSLGSSFTRKSEMAAKFFFIKHPSTARQASITAALSLSLSILIRRHLTPPLTAICLDRHQQQQVQERERESRTYSRWTRRAPSLSPPWSAVLMSVCIGISPRRDSYPPLPLLWCYACVDGVFPTGCLRGCSARIEATVISGFCDKFDRLN